MLMGIVAPAGAQSTTTDGAALQNRALAAEAARQVLSLAGSRNFNAMYDLMHPDSMAIAPRAAVVGLFDAVYTQAQAGAPQIVEVQLVDYTWRSPARRIVLPPR